jgi:hypothetical protein
MQWTAWIGLALGVVMAATPNPGTKLKRPPVILELGPVVPTPVPTAKHATRKRLITVITVRNSPNRETVVSFEATDVADEGEERVRTLASKTYSLAEEDPGLDDLKEHILQQIRDLEREMLKYAEKAGPPKERAPMPPQTRP